MDRSPPQQSRYGQDSSPPNGNLNALIGQNSTSTFQLSVAEGDYLGGSTAGLDFLRANVIPAQANPTGVVYPPFPEYNAQVSWLLSNNIWMLGLRFTSANTSDAINFLNSILITPAVYSPQAMGYQLQNQIPLSQLVSPYQFNPWIVDFMANYLLNGWSFLNLKSSIVAAADYTISLLLIQGVPTRLSDMMPAQGQVMESIPGAPLPPRSALPSGYNSNGQKT